MSADAWAEFWKTLRMPLVAAVPVAGPLLAVFLTNRGAERRERAARRSERVQARVSELKETGRKVILLADTILQDARSGGSLSLSQASMHETITNFYLVPQPPSLAKAAQHWLNRISTLHALRGTPDFKNAIDESYELQGAFIRELHSALREDPEAPERKR